MSTVSIPGGDTAVHWVVLALAVVVAYVLPKLTVVAPGAVAKLTPEIVTAVPPRAAPSRGLIPERRGIGAKLKRDELVAALASPRASTMTSTTPLPAGAVATIDVSDRI